MNSNVITAGAKDVFEVFNVGGIKPTHIRFDYTLTPGIRVTKVWSSLIYSKKLRLFIWTRLLDSELVITDKQIVEYSSMPILTPDFKVISESELLDLLTLNFNSHESIA